MESSLYDLELAADWSLELFPGQLLTSGGPDFSADQGWSVLQGDESPAGGEVGGSPAPSQYSAVESPIAEPLQDSIWSEASDVLGGLVAQSLGGSLKGEWCEGGDIEDSLQFVTPHDLILLTPSEHCPPDPYSASLLENRVSHNIFPPSPLDPSSIDNVKYEYADISAVDPFVLSSPSIATGALDDGIKASPRFPAVFAACGDDGASYAPDVSLELLLLPQEVPTDEDEGIPAELDLGLESASLLRDEQILGMLISLRDATSHEDAPVLSPVSAEDCESILTIPDCPRSPSEGGDSAACDAMVGAPPSPADSEFGTASSIADSSCSTLSTAYLQTVLAPKAASHRRFASPAISPYGVPVEPTTMPAASPVKSEHRRLKKKEQNKTAALRYRVKKREEKGVVLTEVETLEMKNGELRARADDLQREIDYLRALLEEIRRT